MKKLLIAVGLILLIFILWKMTGSKNIIQKVTNVPTVQTSPYDTYPLSITAMKNKKYLGSDIKIEQTLEPGSNYNRYIVSYLSDGLKIYALLTVPTTEKPKDGYPVIVFNHGYIPPLQYVTTERYIAYTDAFSRDGYVLIKPDYRGNGNSEGKAEGAYYSPAYTTDVMNALSSVKRLKNSDFDPHALTSPNPLLKGEGSIVNSNKIGMWGHSMGGNITLRSLELTKDIKVAVIWGGVVGSYNDLSHNWQRRVTYQPPPSELTNRNGSRQQLVAQYGDPSLNGPFWQAIDPTKHLNLITAPLQLHVGSVDEEVPPDFSQHLFESLKILNKPVEFYEYDGSDHNISQGFDLAMQRSVEFFDKYLK